VTCSVTLLGAHDEQLSSAQIGNFSLPIEPATWSPRFHRFASSHLWDYLEASKATLFIEGDDLGRFALRLERDVKPLSRRSRSQTGRSGHTTASAVRVVLDDPPIHIHPDIPAARGCKPNEPLWVHAIPAHS